MSYGRIKAGTRIMQDHAFTAWPYTTGEHHGGPPAREDTLFKFEKTGNGLAKATAYGFGLLRHGDGKAYGNGVIYILGAKHD